MADYVKRKNDELAALCKERGLPHTGKKADLVKRLEEFDSSTSSKAGGDTDAAEETKNESKTKETTNKEAPNQSAAEDEEPSKEPAGESEKKVPAEDFSLGLQERTLDEEIEKRKKRAEKFGLDPKDDETLKQLERAKRFGTNNLPGLLNQALPERAAKNKKRGRDAKEESKDSRKRSRQREDKPANGEGKKQAPKKEADGKYPSWMTEKDREAADRRKTKFNTVAE